MPLLHRKPFVREKPPADLRPDEHVFHCRVTNEIFRDYDEFFERTILCNSLVWSCAVTGKSGFTYQEALESERKARQNIQNFPEPLIVPVLYLVTLTQRSRLHEVCDDIFAYIKNRYFVGELVEVLRNNGERLHCKILEVKAPVHQNGMANGHTKGVDGVTIIISDSDDSDLDTSSAQIGNEKAITDPFLYKYKVKPIKKQLYESVTVKTSQIRRRKHIFSYDRLKLFLKQHCESHDGIIKIKAISVAKYKIAEQTFSYLFPDNPPIFMFSPSSKQKRRPSKLASDDHEDRIAEEHFCPRNLSNTAKERVKLQNEKQHMRISEKLKREKANAVRYKRKEKQDKEKRKEELKKLVEEERLKKKEEKERLKIEKEKEREKLREEKKKYLEHLKQWSKRREDMECDDLKELPVPTPVKTRLPPEIFGDAVMVLEFLHAFGELFDLQDEFPDGVTLEVLEEALVGNDSEGPLCELLFFFLTAIFQAMAEEEEEIAKDQIADAETKDLTEALDEDADPTKSALSAVATLAAAWPQLHQGCNLKNLDLDSCTLSEILRLHILASGADVTSANAKYRYQKRGGFDATDDACMELRLSNPGLLKKLSYTSVYDLSSAEKMTILHALCGKLLTLVSTRDFIEDSVDVLRQTKQEFRELKAEQHRREREAAAAKIRRRKEERLKGQEQKMKEKHEKLKEEQKNPAIEVSVNISDEDREELDTSTDSKEVETKEQEIDAMTDEEDNSMPNKKKGGRRGQNGFKDFTRQGESTDDKCELLTAEEEAVLKQEQQNKEKELIEKIQKATACTNISPGALSAGSSEGWARLHGAAPTQPVRGRPLPLGQREGVAAGSMAGLALRLPSVVRLWRRQSLRGFSWPRTLFSPAAPGGAGWVSERCRVAALPPGTLRPVPPVSRSASSWAAAAESSRKKPGAPQGTEPPSEAGPGGRAVSDAKRLLALAYPERWKLTAAVGFLAISSVITMSAPFFLGKVIDVIYTNPTGELAENLSTLCALLTGIFIFGATANGIRVYLMQISGQRIVKRLRETIFSSLLRQEVAFFDKTSTGELINRLSSDTTLLGRSVTENLSDGLRAAGQASAAVGMMFFVSPKLATFVLTVVPSLAVIAVLYGTYLRKLTRMTQDSLAEATQLAEERIGNLRTVRAFGHELTEMEKYQNKIQYVLQLAKKEAIARAGFFGATGLSGNLIVLFVLYKGGLLLGSAHMTVGELSSFLMYAFWVGISIRGLSSFYTELMKGLGAGGRLWELIDRKPQLPFNEGTVLNQDAFKGALEFKNVKFAYPTRPESLIFQDFSLSIPAGSVMALVGPSGSGKSTVVSLLLRLYDPLSGSITVDGVDIRQLNPLWFRTNIGTVSQEPTLFSCSIAENIAYGAEDPSTVTPAEIERVARIANASNFIQNFPKGFHTLVGEKGVLLSGGQKQRIAIARALLKNPKILLLDEATSALDVENEYLVQEALDRLMEGRTVLIIAHRLSTIQNTNSVAVLDQGRIVESGKHETLLANPNGLFSKLMKKQSFIQNIEHFASN